MCPPTKQSAKKTTDCSDSNAYSIFDPLIKVWWGICFAFCILTAWFSTKLTSLLLAPFLARDELCQIATQCCAFAYGMLFAMNPAVSLKPIEGSLDWDEVFQEGKGAPMILMNHSSMLDGFVFTGACPYKCIKSVRTLAKAALFKLPVFGGMLESCGHFPVYFNSSKLGSFSVDKEAQAKVQTQMQAHIDAGGAISLFPEGQVNRGDYRQLQSFRRGSMAIAKNQVKLGGAVYGFLMVGVTEAWPTAESLPSHGADVRYKLFEIKEIDLSLELPEFTNSIEQQMQAEMDLVVAAAEAERMKKFA